MWSPPWSEQTSLFDSTTTPGGIRVWLLEDREQCPGASWTADISECPSDVAVCTPVSLSEVLVSVEPSEPYWLSPKACAGILRRAAKRGKRLPEPLERALAAAAQDITGTKP